MGGPRVPDPECRKQGPQGHETWRRRRQASAEGAGHLAPKAPYWRRRRHNLGAGGAKMLPTVPKCYHTVSEEHCCRSEMNAATAVLVWPRPAFRVCSDSLGSVVLQITPG